MTAQVKPPADIAADERLVRTLLEQQHPDLAAQPVSAPSEGWDNYMFRLGDDLAIRLPRRMSAAPMIDREQRWLPQLAPRLPLPIPVAVRIGQPTDLFPWPWSIVPWLQGHSAVEVQPDDWEDAARRIGRFLGALHTPAPFDAPLNPWRSIPLADRTPRLHEHLDLLGNRIDRERVLRAWDRVIGAGPWTGPRLWLHGDPHPGNVVVHEGRVGGIIDWGDITAGDPATDLALAWIWFPAAEREGAIAALDESAGGYDAATWERARGWALAMAVAVMAIGGADPLMGPIFERTVDATL